jgi:hypothetical protein
LCYVERMLAAFGCDCTLRWARRWRDLRLPRATGPERRLLARGGFCDCEVFLNGWGLRAHLLVPDADGEPAWPAERPPCAGVGPARRSRAPSGSPGGVPGGNDGRMGAMGQVVATAERVVRAPVDRVRSALADYEGTRPRVLPEQFSGYRVESGGQGAGTRVAWRFAATSKRVRDQLVEVSQPDPDTLVETDTRSSMVTTWTLHPADAGLTTVRVRTTWNGAGGIGGFFERTFAPKGLRRVYEDLLGRLDREVATS